MSQYQYTQYQDQDQDQNQNDQQEQDRFELINRISSYSWVQYLSGTVKNYYDYAKESNFYIKAGLETAEAYTQPVITKLDEVSHQPIVNGIITSVDSYGCKQLDRIEDTVSALKDTTYDTVEKAAEKIHGTKVESILLKTVDVVDNVVDSLLPPPENEQNGEDEKPIEDPNLVERTAPVIKKISNRVSKDSIKNLPHQTYHEVKELVFKNAESYPQVQYCIGVLSTASHKVLHAKESTEEAAKRSYRKGAELSRASIDHLHQSLSNLLTVMTSLVAGISKVSVDDAKASLNEVSEMIQESKRKIFVNNAALKEDVSRILQRAGDVLSQQLAGAYDKAAHSDHASVRRAAAALDTVVHRIIESIPTSDHQQSHEHEHSKPAPARVEQ